LGLHHLRKKERNKEHPVHRTKPSKELKERKVETTIKYLDLDIRRLIDA